MPTHPPTPTFRGIPILIDCRPGVRNARIVHAAICGFVKRIQDNDGTLDELLLGLHDLVAQYEGAVPTLVGRTPTAIEFTVTRR